MGIHLKRHRQTCDHSYNDRNPIFILIDYLPNKIIFLIILQINYFSRALQNFTKSSAP